ncbi:MAG TPA: hypothetical protein VN034_07965 [Sphingopyxis sp.]|nr:hypothetical protein [Sphingopyxis sp.]
MRERRRHERFVEVLEKLRGSARPMISLPLLMSGLADDDDADLFVPGASEKSKMLRVAGMRMTSSFDTKRFW